MDLGSPDTPRWVQRFENYRRALALLRTAMELLDDGATRIEDPAILSAVKEGAIQRFEYTFELAWKTLKDYLLFNKVGLTKTGPADVIRAAFAANYIDEGQDWMDALDARNEMSHVYREQAFERVLDEIRVRFLARLEDLNDTLTAEWLNLQHR